MVNGRINRIVESSGLASDRDLQQRLLGVGRHSDAGFEINADANGDVAARPPSPRPPSLAPKRVYVSNPAPPTRWSQPVPIARIEASARTLSTGVLRLEEAAPPRRHAAAARSSGPPTLLLGGPPDTNGDERRFLRDLRGGSGLRARLVDVSARGQ